MRIYTQFHKKALPSKKIRFHRTAALSKNFFVKDLSSPHSLLKNPNYILSKAICIENAIDFGYKKSRIDFNGGPLIVGTSKNSKESLYSCEKNIIYPKNDFPDIKENMIFRGPSCKIFFLFPLFFSMLKKL